MSTRHIQNIFKASSRRLPDIFKIYYQVKLFLLTCVLDVFKTLSRRIQHVFETYFDDDYLQKDLPRPHVQEISLSPFFFCFYSSLCVEFDISF